MCEESLASRLCLLKDMKREERISVRYPPSYTQNINRLDTETAQPKRSEKTMKGLKRSKKKTGSILTLLWFWPLGSFLN